MNQIAAPVIEGTINREPTARHAELINAFTAITDHEISTLRGAAHAGMVLTTLKMLYDIVITTNVWSSYAKEWRTCDVAAALEADRQIARINDTIKSLEFQIYYRQQ
jgi:hypothetical protein